MEIRKSVGTKIRMYRQLKKMTLVELAAKIHKSKATLSKYEVGDIAVDIETLVEIGRALGINPHQLLEVPKERESAASPQGSSFFTQSRIYAYFYDGRSKRIIKNLLEISNDFDMAAATFFNDVPSFDQLEDCRNLYYGKVEYYDTVTNFSFMSQSNRIERLSLCAINPFDRGEEVLGMLSGLSRYPMLPVSIKCILSPKQIKETEAFKERLLLSQKDIKYIRSLNMFAFET